MEKVYSINDIAISYEKDDDSSDKLFVINLLIKSIINNYLINQTSFVYFLEFNNSVLYEIEDDVRLMNFMHGTQIDSDEKFLVKLEEKIDRLGNVIKHSRDVDAINEAVSDVRTIISEKEYYLFNIPKINIYKQSERKENEKYKATSFIKYISYIHKIINKEKNLLWFRGHTRRKYQLVPSIFRQRDDIMYENDMMKKFMINASGFSNEVPVLSDYITWLPFMQHYELPTRLLDWTDSPFCALFFALDDDLLYHNELKKITKTYEHDSIIYVFKCSDWNRRMHDMKKIPCLDIEKNNIVNDIGSRAFKGDVSSFELYPIAVTATRKYARMRNQKANFTLHDNAFDMYSLYPEFFYKIEIPYNCKQKILTEMYKFGIDKTMFFPELTALAEVTKKFA